MPVPRHLTDDGIPGRVPASYRGNSGNESSSDDTGTIPVRGSKSLEMLHQNGVFFGCRSIRFAEVQDGLSNTLFVGESQTDPDFTRDNNAMDYWSIGSPQIDPCQCDGGNAGTEFSEAVGSAFARLNLRQLEPTPTASSSNWHSAAIMPTEPSSRWETVPSAFSPTRSTSKSIAL